MPAMRSACVLLTAASLAAPPVAAAAPAAAPDDELRPPPEPVAVEAPADAALPRLGTADEEATPSTAAAEPERSKDAGSAPAEGAPPPPAAGRDAAAASEGTFAASAEAAPTRMRPLQRAGWWTVAGAAVLGTVAGVLSSLSRAQEDRLNTIAGEIDPQTGKFPTYADVADDYEDALSKGRKYATGAQVVAGIAGAALVTGLVLMFVDARRENKRARGGSARARRRVPRRRRMRIRGLAVSF